MPPDTFAAFKAAQRDQWKTFAPLEALTTPVAGHLVRFAGVRQGQTVLDVACGTGVVAITAARRGALATGLDLTPELLAKAKENAAVLDLDIPWKEGDAENLPFRDGEFDAVLSQFGHIFAPRAQRAADEMLRVLKPGGTLAFASWPPQFFVGRLLGLVGSYLPASDPKPDAPGAWGDTAVIPQRLGARVRDLAHDAGTMRVPALSPQHFRATAERNIGPMQRAVQALAGDPARLAEMRREFDRLAGLYLEDNVLHQDYLLTRAAKA